MGAEHDVRKGTVLHPGLNGHDGLRSGTRAFWTGGRPGCAVDSDDGIVARDDGGGVVEVL